MKIIRGDGYRTFAGHALDRKGFKHNPEGRPDCYFVKIDLLHDFATIILPAICSPFILISGDGCLRLSEGRHGVSEILNSTHLVRWLATNVEIVHPKVFSIPIGLGHSYERIAAEAKLAKVMEMSNEKTTLVYANYSMGSNRKVREMCLQETQVKFPKTGFNEHLVEVSKAFFNISPEGSGVDCYRHWESIYLKTIPIVTDSINMKFYKDMPYLVIKEWPEYKKLQLNRDLYERIWNGFNIERLDADRYIQEVLVRKHPFF